MPKWSRNAKEESLKNKRKRGYWRRTFDNLPAAPGENAGGRRNNQKKNDRKIVESQNQRRICLLFWIVWFICYVQPNKS
jgi:hypothetical protein